MKITREQYDSAVAAKTAAEETIREYFKQRMRENPIFTADELTYSAGTLCPCGFGLAYPKDCGPGHYWDCSAILTGTENPTATHTGKLPFSFYDVKSESEHRGTTRGVFKPKPKA
jgi:hypothetical protein